MKKKLLIILVSVIAGVSVCCGLIYVIIKSSKPCTHAHGEWITETEPTCTEEGVKSFVCSKCGAVLVKNEKIPAKGHTYSSDWSQSETEHWHEAICGHKVDIDRVKHNFINNVCVDCKYDRSAPQLSITLNKTVLTLLVGDSATLIATILPNNSLSDISWSSSAPNIAIIENGIVTAVAKGSAVITAKFNDVSATCFVTVDDSYEDFSFSFGENGYTLTRYSGNQVRVAVPSSYNGKLVTAIGDRAFYDCSQITEVFLPDTIKEIGSYAFGYCTALSDVEISACTRVSDYAFSGCTSLKEAVLPNGIVYLGSYLFENCNSLKKVTVLSGSVQQNTFAKSVAIEEIILGENISSVAQRAFAACSSLKYLTMPRIDETQTFNKYYFDLDTKHSSLLKLTITNQTISIYNEVLKDCTCEIDVKQKFPVESISLVGESEVYLDEFDIDNYTVKVKHTDGFVETFTLSEEFLQSDINDLKTAGEKTLSFGYGGVSGQFSLQLKLHVFENVTMDDLTVVRDGTIKSLVVKGAPDGTTITYENNGQTEVGEYTVTATLENPYYETKILTATLYIRQETYNITYVIGEKEVSNNNPSEYRYGSEISLANPISKIAVFGGWYTDKNYNNKFGGITATTYGDITLYAKFTSIFTLSGNTITGLTDVGKTFTEIVIPSSINGVEVKDIGSEAFKNCSKLTSITIGNSVTNIGPHAFLYCSGLTGITIGSGVTSIGCDAFLCCNGLENIYITDIATWCNIDGLWDLMEYGSSNKKLYLNNKLIIDLVIPDSVTSIASYAFLYCRGLTSVTIPDSVTSIGSSAFV